MKNFLYITDVFCPWCYAFSPVMHRLASAHPAWPVRVLCGNMVDEAATVAEMSEEMPHIREFFARLTRTTGQTMGADFLRRLEPGTAEGEALRMYSPGVALPLQALKTLAPGKEAEQMTAFQHAFFGEGLDVLSSVVQHKLAASYNLAASDFDAALRDEAVGAAARQEAEEADAILDEFVLYPTLYLEDENGRQLIARGFVTYQTAKASLDMILTGAFPAVGALSGQGESCGPDEACGRDKACGLPKP